MKKEKGFTLIELIAVLVILAILALIVTPLVLNIVRKVKDSANKRSIDAYGKAVELSIATYLLDTGNFPTSIDELTIEYSGKEVVCNTKQLNEDSSVYLSECKVGNSKVKDSSTDDGWYHYGELKLTAIKLLLSKSNDESITTYTEGNTHEMYTFTHDATEQTEALTDYRYIGNDPYNYVTFNNELWRIIGVFTVEDENGNKEQRLKIIRDESIGNYAWNSNGSNEWSTASLQTYLNGEYYTSLSDEAKAMIGDSKYYLGGRTYDLTTQQGTATDIYNFERGTTVYSENSTNWIGKIGLMYPSDYVYTYAFGVDDKCYTDTINCSTSNRDSNPSNGWLYNHNYQWLITPDSVNSRLAFLVDLYGYLRYYSGYGITGAINVRPSTYLISSIQIDKGTGMKNDPYTLK